MKTRTTIFATALFAVLLMAGAGTGSAQNSASASADAEAMIVAGISLEKVLDLKFGSIVRSAEGGSVTLDPNSDYQIAEFETTGENKYLYTISLPGEATLTLRPFLDLNGNDVRDEYGPLVPDIGLSIPGGSLRRSADSTIRVLNLLPHRPYVLTVNDAVLPDISWKAKYHSWEVTARPNRFQTIDIPVVVVGEINGRVYRKKDGRGMAGIIVRFEQTDGDYSDSSITFDGGEYFYMGLPPGHYVASLDAEQSHILGLTPEQARFTFEIRAAREGDFIEGIDFRLE